jgi:hypothetical protein
LKDHFKTAGKVLFADVATDSEGKSKGYGFIEFGTPAEAIGIYIIIIFIYLLLLLINIYYFYYIIKFRSCYNFK